jgi:hypothetical protein
LQPADLRESDSDKDQVACTVDDGRRETEVQRNMGIQIALRARDIHPRHQGPQSSNLNRGDAVGWQTAGRAKHSCPHLMDRDCIMPGELSDKRAAIRSNLDQSACVTRLKRLSHRAPADTMPVGQHLFIQLVTGGENAAYTNLR